MNTKIASILIALAMASAVFVGVAAADTIYTGNLGYSYTQTLNSNPPTDQYTDSGANFYSDITGIDPSYVGYGSNEVAGEVYNTIATTIAGTGVYHDSLVQSGYATQLIRSLDSTDGLPELEMATGTGQSLSYTGSITDYEAIMNSDAYVGEYGCVSNGLPGCGNCVLYSDATGVGHTWVEDDEKITGGAFWMTESESLTADIEGVSRYAPNILVAGSVAGGSSFTAAIGRADEPNGGLEQIFTGMDLDHTVGVGTIYDGTFHLPSP